MFQIPSGLCVLERLGARVEVNRKSERTVALLSPGLAIRGDRHEPDALWIGDVARPVEQAQRGTVARGAGEWLARLLERSVRQERVRPHDAPDADADERGAEQGALDR